MKGWIDWDTFKKQLDNERHTAIQYVWKHFEKFQGSELKNLKRTKN